MRISKSDTNTKILALIIASFTVLVFLPALQNGFVNWDDGLYVYDNPDIKNLDTGLLRYMVSYKNSLWIPLTRLSHGLDHAFWGLDPMGHHLTNIIFHGLNTFLMVILVFRLIEARGSALGREVLTPMQAFIAACAAGMLFGVHPLRVESVAWVTERKDVMSGFFILLSLLYYLRFSAASAEDKKSCYLLSFIFFAAALMSKPIAVTLPAVLLILDLYPLNRRLSLKTLTEKVPFFVLSTILSIVTVISYRHEGIMVLESEVAVADRLLVAVRSLSLYLYNMLWPAGLVPFHPYPKDISLLAPEFALPVFAVLIITVFCLFRWKRERLWGAAWMCYIVTLLPVLGVIKFSGFASADRYTYLPAIGPFILAGLGAALVYRRFIVNRSPAIFFVPLAALICLLSLLTVRQINIWEDSYTLWSAQIERFPEDHLGYVNLGVAYATDGIYEEALKNLDRSVELEPADKKGLMNRGKVLETLGRYEEAVENYEQALRYYPELETAYYNLGLIHDAHLKNYPEALKNYNRAITIKPDYTSAYNNRGIVHAILGDYQKAVDDFTSAIRLNSSDASAYVNRGHAYKRLGYIVKAEKDFRAAKELKGRK